MNKIINNDLIEKFSIRSYIIQNHERILFIFYTFYQFY